MINICIDSYSSYKFSLRDAGTSSEEHSEEHSDLASEDEQEEEAAAYKEPSMYDNLLKTLGSASESIADAYQRRQSLFTKKIDMFLLFTHHCCILQENNA